MGIRTGSSKQHGLWGLVLAGVAGLLLGLLIAWVIAPVRWKDTDPVDLRAAHQEAYVLMIADSYAINGDVQLAQERLQQLSPDGSDLTPVIALVEQAVASSLARGDSAATARISRLADDTGLAQWTAAAHTSRATVAPEVEPTSERAQAVDTARASVPSWVLLIFGLGILIVALAAVAGLLLARSNKRAVAETEFPVFDAGLAPLAEAKPALKARSEPPTAQRRPSLEELLGINEPAAPALEPASEQDEPLPDIVALEQEETAEEDPFTVMEQPTQPAPSVAVQRDANMLAEFDVTYRYGDDDFYQSVTIDTPEESFVGQCGIVISDVLGANDAQQVAAFDVWLFETRGTRTVSKVLLSPWAAANEGIVARLSRKGETIATMPELTVTLQTLSLRLTAQVTDVAFQPNEQFPDGIFAQLALHMCVERLSP